MVRENTYSNQKKTIRQGYKSYDSRETEEIAEIEKYFKDNILNISKLRNEYDTFIKKSKDYAKYLKNKGLTTSQIRKVYSDIINADDAMELKRLRPKLAYIQGRNIENKAIKSFLNILDKGIERLNPNSDEDEIKSLKEFAETIVAYRKYYGDKK